MTSPAQAYVISIFFEYFLSDLGISRSLVSALFAVSTFVGSVFFPSIGKQVDKIGSRLAVLLTLIIYGLHVFSLPL